MSANNDAFNEAISLHQNKKYDEALAAYMKLLDKSQSETLTREQASTISQNIAVLYMQQGNTNLGYIYNKKALSLNPQNSAAAELSKNTLSSFKVSEITRDIPAIEQINNLGLKYMPMELLAVFVLLFIYLVLKNLFRFLVERKKALTVNKLPAGLNWSFYAFLSGLFICTVLWGVKYNESLQMTGIIKSPSAAVQTAAGANQAIITEVSFGQVVQILQTKDVDGTIYAQIKVSGAFSGWIKKADLETLNSVN